MEMKPLLNSLVWKKNVTKLKIISAGYAGFDYLLV